eukprot:tig00000361_g24358.t1
MAEPAGKTSAELIPLLLPFVFSSSSLERRRSYQSSSAAAFHGDADFDFTEGGVVDAYALRGSTGRERSAEDIIEASVPAAGRATVFLASAERLDALAGAPEPDVYFALRLEGAGAVSCSASAVEAGEKGRARTRVVQRDGDPTFCERFEFTYGRGSAESALVLTAHLAAGKALGTARVPLLAALLTPEGALDRAVPLEAPQASGLLSFAKSRRKREKGAAAAAARVRIILEVDSEEDVARREGSLGRTGTARASPIPFDDGLGEEDDEEEAAAAQGPAGGVHGAGYAYVSVLAGADLPLPGPPPGAASDVPGGLYIEVRLGALAGSTKTVWGTASPVFAQCLTFPLPEGPVPPLLLRVFPAGDGSRGERVPLGEAEVDLGAAADAFPRPFDRALRLRSPGGARAGFLRLVLCGAAAHVPRVCSITSVTSGEEGPQEALPSGDPALLAEAHRPAVRAGLAPHARRPALLGMSGAARMMKERPGAYDEALRETFGPGAPYGPACAVPSFGAPEAAPGGVPGGYDALAELAPPAVQSVRRLLIVIAMTRPDAVYCAPLPAILCLLARVLSEREMYYAACALLDRSREVPPPRSRFLDTSRSSAALSWAAAVPLAEKHAPGAVSLLRGAGAEPAQLLRPWLESAFLGHVPLATAEYALDAAVCEGAKALHRAALALLRLGEERARASSARPKAAPAHELLEAFRRAAASAAPPALAAAAWKSMSTRGAVDAFRAAARADPRKLLAVVDAWTRPPAPFHRPRLLPPQPAPAGLDPRNLPSSILVRYEMVESLWRLLPERDRLRDWRLAFSCRHHGCSLRTLLRKQARTPYPPPSSLPSQTALQRAASRARGGAGAGADVYGFMRGGEREDGARRPTLLLLKTGGGRVLGLFSPELWRISFERYYGSRDNFLFVLEPGPARAYPAVPGWPASKKRASGGLLSASFAVPASHEESGAETGEPGVTGPYQRASWEALQIGSGGEDGASYALEIQGDLCGASSFPNETYKSPALCGPGVASLNFQIVELELFVLVDPMQEEGAARRRPAGASKPAIA